MSNRNLIEIIKKIYYHKNIRIKGFKILEKNAKDEHIKNIIQRFSSEEKNLVDIWFKKIKEIDKKTKIKNGILTNIKKNFTFQILGPKGFLFWTIKGETESIQEFEIELEKNKKPDFLLEWKLLVSDERLHLERIKRDFIGEDWDAKSGGGVKDMIFGINDGLVSTLAFIMGAYGAFMESRIVLISGFAELLAGTISMAVSSYQSTKSEVEVIEKEYKDNFLLNNKTENQKEDLINFYQKKGFTSNEAEAIARQIQKNKDSKVTKKQKSAIKQLGLSSETLRNPVRSGFLCGLSFGLAALIPIFAFALPIRSSEAVFVSIVVSNIALFGAGCLKTIFSRKNWIRSGLEMMIIGIGAAMITYFIGTLFSLFV